MNKYYIVQDNVVDGLKSYFKISDYMIEVLDKNSILLHTELTLEELREYLDKIPLKIPY